MSAWHAALAIPMLASGLDPVLVGPTAATLGLTAPDPVIANAAAATAANAIITAPDPSLGGVIEITAASLLLTAPDPERVGADVLAISGSTVGLIAVDPTFVQPARIAVPSALANLTAPDPTITYGFVSSVTGPAFPGVPPSSSQGSEHRRQIAATVNRTLQGKIACTGTFTLLPNVPSTYWRDSRLGAESWVEFDPLTANATAEKAAGTMYVLEADRQDGQWLITHANGASTDRKFRFSILG